MHEALKRNHRLTTACDIDPVERDLGVQLFSTPSLIIASGTWHCLKCPQIVPNLGITVHACAIASGDAHAHIHQDRST